MTIESHKSNGLCLFQCKEKEQHIKCDKRIFFKVHNVETRFTDVCILPYLVFSFKTLTSI